MGEGRAARSNSESPSMSEHAFHTAHLIDEVSIAASRTALCVVQVAMGVLAGGAGHDAFCAVLSAGAAHRHHQSRCAARQRDLVEHCTRRMEA